MIDRGEFAEWAEVHASSVRDVPQGATTVFRAGQDAILDVDTRGAAILRAGYPEGIFIFIVPPSWAVPGASGSDSDAAMPRWTSSDVCPGAGEVRQYAEYQYVIVNDVFARAADDLKAIILAERRRSHRVKRDSWMPDSIRRTVGACGSGVVKRGAGGDGRRYRSRTSWSTWIASIAW